ncbi:MAG: cob(I)yrinic acid a,c-diamide adenosyltransferase [Planctomycetaceae bacterium]|jgi:cob(I)alamin adenosyltransferase|nr:cob(I)yrinic acid a,c-diamide adenosyltransferase [Planctomycetaceae bacterium]
MSSPNSNLHKSQIYTRTGDEGETSLAGGVRVAKDNARIDVIGEIDELSAVLGVARSMDGGQKFCQKILRIQNELIRFMSELAVPNNDCRNILQSDVERLESDIDEADAVLPSLKEFIVAGASSQSAYLHLARTVCRRAERRLVLLNRVEFGVSPLLITYLNRLSDLLFVLSRVCDLN